MRKLNVVITGASDGIGLAAAKRLTELGHSVVIVGRSPEKTKKAAEGLGVPYHIADYSRLSDVVRLANELKNYDRIDVLCNNAGGLQGERTLTEDGNEKTFQINVLGEFLLTRLLMDKLAESKAKIIQTASIAANLFGADLKGDDFQNEKDYSPFKAYGYAKLENILFTRELDARYKDKGVCAVAFEPGVVRTNFASESKGFVRFCYHSPLKYIFTVSPRKSAERMVWLALGEPDKDFKRGEVYSKKKIMRLKFNDSDGISGRLWTYCEQVLQNLL
ncbi:MAG: SDR family NAD(P)-dependent oxidoreductase [Clostridia bacterium]|nr:SDR family NAD(P)-dependent oxidoreductase [Clostridia bacterium]